MTREPRALWLLLLAAGTAYAVFSSLVSVWFTSVSGLSRWTLRPDTVAIFPWLLLMNLVMWVGWAIWAPAVFWLGRSFRIDRHGWPWALALHVPASIVITAMHLGMVGSWRFLLQSLRGGQPEWFATVTDAFFRSVDQVLPVYWALIGLQHAIDYHQQARARAERAALLEARLMESQLQALQQQLHPHFLFNTLHAISTLVHRDPDKADLMIERLSDLLRITLHKVNVQEVELAQELDYLRAYLDIEQVHFGDRLRVEYCIDAAVLDALVPTLILQPLVENAVRHGLEPVVRGGTLTIEARADGDTLVVQVKDDGAGYPSARPQQHGVGLTNTRSRLDRLYGEDGVLRISAKPGGGTTVGISLPLRRTADSADDLASEAVA